MYMALPAKDRPYIEIVHDESTCNANDTIKLQYVHSSKSAKLQSKSNGAGSCNIVSGFLAEVLGGILHSDSGVAAAGVWQGVMVELGEDVAPAQRSDQDPERPFPMGTLHLAL